MALALANNKAVFDLVVRMPRNGIWIADLRVDTPEPMTGEVTISIGDGRLTLVGTAHRGGTLVDAASVRVVGGAGALSGQAVARHYTATTVRIVVGDLLRAAGERLSPTSDAAVLNTRLGAWTTGKKPTGSLLTDLLASASPSSVWRVLPDGSVWIGVETWPDSGLKPADYQVIDEETSQQTMLLGVESPTLLPGTLLAGRRVSLVEHTVRNDGVRTKATLEDDTAISDRVREAISGAVRGAMSGGASGPVDHRALYLARVVQQHGSTVDVNPDDGRLPPMSKVPLFGGMPGNRFDGARGGRVLVGWSGGDQKQPFAIGFDADETRGQQIVVNADQIVFGGVAGAEFAAKGTTLDAWLQLFVVWATAHVHLERGAIGPDVTVRRAAAAGADHLRHHHEGEMTDIASFPIDPDGDDLGIDIAVATDLTLVWGLARGRMNLGYALARRLGTPRGALFYDLDYGFDVRSALNAGFTPAQLAAFESGVRSECEKDKRVKSAKVALRFDHRRNTLTLDITVDTADGPFDLILAVGNVTVELLKVDGVLAPVLVDVGPEAQPVVIGPAGPPGPAGPAGVGESVAERVVDDDRQMEVTSGAEEVIFQYIENFDVLPSSLNGRFTAQVRSLSGTSTWRMRVGGTDGAADGTVVATMTSASATYESKEASGSFTGPSGKVMVKLTAQNAVAGQACRLKGMSLTIR